MLHSKVEKGAAASSGRGFDDQRIDTEEAVEQEDEDNYEDDFHEDGIGESTSHEKAPEVKQLA